jgi:hypothetical protein
MTGAIIAYLTLPPYRQEQFHNPVFPVSMELITAVAVGDWLLNGNTLDKTDLKVFLAKWKQKYHPPSAPYSFKNDNPILAAVPIGLWAPCPETAFYTARLVAGTIYPTKLRIECTALLAEAACLAAMKTDKNEINAYLESRYGYDLSFEAGEKHPKSLQTVETAIRVFLSGSSFRKAYKAAEILDDPLASAIACGLTEAYCGIPYLTRRKAIRSLPEDIREIVKQIWAQNEKRHVAQSITSSRSRILNQNSVLYKRKKAG